MAVDAEVVAAMRRELTGPGGRFEMVRETVAWPDGSCPHHRGVEYDVFKGGIQVLPDLFKVPEASGKLDREFIVYDEERLTFRQALEMAASLGHTLVNDMGVGRGDRVAIVSRNFPEYLIAIIAITSVGATAVPMNSLWVTSELEYGLENAEPVVVLCDQERLDRIAPVLNKLRFIRHVVLLRSEVPAGADARVERYADVLARGRGMPMPAFPCSKDDNAMIMYTSGTTGHPKGVVLHHRSMAHSINSALASSALGRMVGKAAAKAAGKSAPGAARKAKKANPAILLCVPLFHATGVHGVFLPSFVTGRKIVMMYKWNPSEALRLIERERITQFTGVPTMVLEMLQHPDAQKYDTSSLAAVGGGGAPPPPSMVKQVASKFKASPTQGYGMTETNAVVCLNASASYLARPTSCGRPVPGVIVEIWDEHDNRLPPGTPGRVMMKGANMMKEYWRKPEATAKVMTAAGYLDSGDIGRVDEDGFVYIMDRAKDMIIRGGENISCAEVEARIFNCDAVAEAAVFGVPEEVGVAVLPKPGRAAEVTLAAMQAACSDLAAFKRPAHLFVYSKQLPRGATGKILKTKIREETQSMPRARL